MSSTRPSGRSHRHSSSSSSRGGRSRSSPSEPGDQAEVHGDGSANVFAFDSILHPTDFSESDHGAVVHALKIALAAHAKLTFLHVGPKDADVAWEDFPQVRSILAQWGVIGPEARKEEVLATGMTVRKSLRKGDDIVAQIAGEARSGKSDLIVLATHQRQGIARWMSKPLAETIAREVRKPTLFVPRQIEGFVKAESGGLRLSRVLIPIAERPRPEQSVRAAVALARLLTPEPVRFSLLHVRGEGRVPELEMESPDPARCLFEPITREGGTVDVILDESEEQGADLVVMATDGREGFLDALRGTTTEQVLRGVKCPLLAVPA